MVLTNFPSGPNPEPADLAHLRTEFLAATEAFIRELAGLQQHCDKVQRSLATLSNQVDGKVAEIIRRFWEQPDESRVVLGKSGHQIQLKETLKQAKTRVLIVNPWLRRDAFDGDMLSHFTSALNRHVQIHLGWGWQQDIGNIIIPGNGCWNLNPPNTWKYDALPKLQHLRRRYPEQFQLKLMGTHAKFWVCDHKFAAVGSANVLCSKPRGADSAHAEVGLLTTNRYDIQELIHCFETAPNLAARQIERG